jgi:hypothetical protein
VARPRAQEAPWTEEFHVVAVAVVKDKARPSFERLWSDVTAAMPMP